MEEKKLVEAAQAGEERAIYQLYKKYSEQVYRFCLSYGGVDSELAKDVVQDTFIRAFRNLHKLREPEKFKIWLLTIARNRLLSQLMQRDNFNKKVSSLEKESEEFYLPSYAEEMETQRQIEIVRQVIEELPEGGMKECARAFYIEGLNTSEIAERLNIPKSTVTTRLDRFRAKVAKKILRKIAER